MRLLHINSGNLYGGIEVMLGTLARHRALCPRLEVEFALCFPGRLQQELTDAGTPVHMLGEVRVSRPWTVWQARHRLQEVLQSHAFDAVVCHGSWSLAVFAPAVRRRKITLVLWLHTPPSPRLHWLERWASWHQPDLTICNSDFTRAGAARLFPQGRSTRIYCPVHFPGRPFVAEERRALRKQYDTAEGDVVILQAGRWDPYKGHVFLLQALARLAHLPGWTCWQVGAAQNDGERKYLDSIRAAAAQLGIADRLRFLGFQDNQTALPGVMAAADVYCQPNLAAEPFGITFIEALQSRLPIVTTALGGALEIVDGSCGILVPPGSVEELTAALQRLVENASCRQELGREGPARARMLTEPGDRLADLASELANLVAGPGPVVFATASS